MALAFAACGSSGGGGGAPTDANVPAPGLGPIGTGVNPNQCQIGQVFTPQNGCLNQMGCPAGFGYIPQTQQCVQGTVVTTNQIFGTPSTGRFYGTMAISNSSQFQLLLKYARLCDPYWVGWNWGSWSCGTYANSGFIQLQYFSGMNAQTTNATMYVGAGAGMGGLYQYSSMSSGSIGFSQQARVAPGNNSAGMFIDGVGPDGSSVGLKLVVNTGNFVTNPALATFSADVFYQGVKFATITFNRY